MSNALMVSWRERVNPYYLINDGGPWSCSDEVKAKLDELEAIVPITRPPEYPKTVYNRSILQDWLDDCKNQDLITEEESKKLYQQLWTHVP